MVQKSCDGRGRGATESRGSIDPPLFQVRGPHMALDPSLFVVFTCAQSVAVVIHSLHSALASGAVYCNRSCLCVCGGWVGGCPNLTTASARAVFASLRALFSFIQLLLFQLTTDNDRSKRSEVEVE